MDNMTRAEALTEIRAIVKPLGMEFNRSKTKHNGCSLWILEDSASGKVLIENYDLWTAYSDCMSGYVEGVNK